MARGKDARVTIILECTSCEKNRVNKESMGNITKKNRHNTPEKILYLLLQTYDSRGDKEIDLTDRSRVRLAFQGRRKITYFILQLLYILYIFI